MVFSPVVGDWSWGKTYEKPGLLSPPGGVNGDYYGGGILWGGYLTHMGEEENPEFRMQMAEFRVACEVIAHSAF